MSADGGPRGRTILVTGGAGFIGSHLATSLVDDNVVRVLDDCSAGDPESVPEGVRFVRADVRDPEAVADAASGVDLLFHLAAVVSVDESIADPRRCHSTNVDGTLNVLETARELDARAVVTSSAAIYGEPESVPVSEDHPTEPRSPYGLDKHAADRYARLYHDLYGVETVVLRPFNVYGPGQSGEYAGVVSTFLEQAAADDPITVEGDGEQIRDFVHVRDVVSAYRRAAVAGEDSVGAAFNVGTGESVTIRTLAETIRTVVRSESEIVHTDPRPGDVQRSRADVSASREVLGYRPTVGLREGLRTILNCS